MTNGRKMQLASKPDGFILDAYHTAPEDARQGGLVLVQEIFGVTEHIREVCDGFAADGYEVIAPNFYDRLEPDFAASYSPEDVAKGGAVFPGDALGPGAGRPAGGHRRPGRAWPRARHRLLLGRHGRLAGRLPL